MFQKLRDTSLSLDQTERGLRCGQDGLFLGGDCALITRETLDETDLYRVRPLLEINSLLSAGYGAEIDFSANLLPINRVAGLLQKGELGLAQIVALQMRLPELSDDQSVDRLRKADRFLRFNPNHKPPGPGAVSSRLGRKAPRQSVEIQSRSLEKHM